MSDMSDETENNDDGTRRVIIVGGPKHGKLVELPYRATGFVISKKHPSAEKLYRGSKRTEIESEKTNYDLHSMAVVFPDEGEVFDLGIATPENFGAVAGFQKIIEGFHKYAEIENGSKETH